MTASLNDIDDIARAEAQVAEQRAQLTRSLQAVSRSGQKYARRLGSELKPAIAAAVAVAGAAAVVGISVAIARRSGRRRGWYAPEQPSVVGKAAKAAGLWALRYVARRVAQELVTRLSEPAAPAPALVPPAPNQVER